MKKPNDLPQQAQEGNTGYYREEKVRMVEVSLHQGYTTKKDLQQPSAWDAQVRMEWRARVRMEARARRIRMECVADARVRMEALSAQVRMEELVVVT
jgi:hypothetical protein